MLRSGRVKQGPGGSGIKINFHLGVPLLIPARRIAEVREERVHTLHVLRLVHDVTRPFVFEFDGVHPLDGYGIELGAVAGNGEANTQIISGENKDYNTHEG